MSFIVLVRTAMALALSFLLIQTVREAREGTLKGRPLILRVILLVGWTIPLILHLAGF